MAKESIERAAKANFKSGEITHAWVYGWYKTPSGVRISCTEGRSANESFYRDIFYSYSMPIASRFRTEDGWVYLVEGSNVSATTNGHISSLYRAIPDEVDGIKISKFTLGSGSDRWNYRLPALDNYYSWKNAIDRLLAKAEDCLAKAKKARSNRIYHLSICNSTKESARKLRDIFSKTKDENKQLLIDFPDEMFKEELLLDYIPGKKKLASPNARVTIRSVEMAVKFIPHLPLLGARAFHLGESRIRVKMDNTEGLHPKTTFDVRVDALPWDFIKRVGDGGVITSQGVRLNRIEANGLYHAILQVVKTQEKVQALYWTAYPYKDTSMYHNGSAYEKVMNDWVKIGCHVFHPLSIISDYLHLTNRVLTEQGIIGEDVYGLTKDLKIGDKVVFAPHVQEYYSVNINTQEIHTITSRDGEQITLDAAPNVLFPIYAVRKVETNNVNPEVFYAGVANE